MKIAIAKSLLEPVGIPWGEITSGEDITIDKLVSNLIDEAIYRQDDMDELMRKLAKRIRDSDPRWQK